ncbi:MAG: hypothetical protein AAFZ17_01435 [Cyanobacteria bacterium J06650_10]
MTPEMYQISEQENRESQQDQQAEEWGFATLELSELVKRWGKDVIARELAKLPDATPAPFEKTCGMCQHHRLNPEHCSLRAAADLDYISFPATSTHAENCPFFTEDCPF